MLLTPTHTRLNSDETIIKVTKSHTSVILLGVVLCVVISLYSCLPSLSAPKKGNLRGGWICVAGPASTCGCYFDPHFRENGWTLPIKRKIVQIMILWAGTDGSGSKLISAGHVVKSYELTYLQFNVDYIIEKNVSIHAQKYKQKHCVKSVFTHLS